MIFSLVYVSAAVEPFERADLSTLLTGCRARNTDLDVTGILLYQDAKFLQLLEGDEDQVRTLYRRIITDPRHRDVVNVWVSQSGRRRFPDWSMGFRHLDDEPIDRPGYSDVLNRPVQRDALGRPGAVEELLSWFKPF